MPTYTFQRMPLTVTLMASPFMYTLQCPVWSVQGMGSQFVEAVNQRSLCKVNMCML